MKIAMIGLRGIPAKSGGVEVVVENLAPRLARLGNEVTVYCRNPYCKTRPDKYLGVNLKYFPTLNTKYTETLMHSLLCSLDASFRNYDLVIYHAMGNGLFSIIPRMTGKKTIVTLHGLDWEREKWGVIAKAYLKFSEKSISILPNKVISVSKKIKDYYLEKYRKEIEFIPNGVEEPNVRELDKLKRFGLQKEKYILFLSRLVPEKGCHYLIDAFKRIDTDAKLLIAGDSTHTQSYEQEIRKMAGSDKRIIIAGPLYGEEKEEAYSNAAFFVLPSTIEGMPMVLLEAMSYGLCPLTSDIRENLDASGNLGFSFRSKDSEDLQRKLEYMLNNSAIIKGKSKRCREMARENHSWDRIAERTHETYKKVLAMEG